ncbi:MAG: hypothetical protein Q8Q18_01120 [bacterium]|nr:hypothetical protein [bacterium]
MSKKKETRKLKTKEMTVAFEEIQMARPPYVLKNMVVGSRHTPEQQYAQCVLELSIAYDNLRLAQCHLEEKDIDIEENNTPGRRGELEREVMHIEQEQLKRAMLGALREFECLYEMWEAFPQKYTRHDLDMAQPTEYKRRLEIQAQHDLNASGRISASNQEGLRQIGVTPYPQLDIGRSIEERYLEGGKSRILLAVPTEHKAEKGLLCIEGLEMPNGSEVKIFNSWGRSVDDSYNHIVQTALEDKADYIITIEDDTFPDKDALVRLMDVLKNNEDCAVGAWYPKREKSKQGVHIVLKNGKRQQMKCDGSLQEAYTMAMGCSIYPIEMFMKIPYPWFKTTANLSQDSFFSQLAREAGFKLLVDTSIKCKHIDRKTGEVFE